MMSVAVVGDDLDLVENLGHESTGTNSTFDKLSRRKDVKFLFLGVGVGDCFTYMHYLEWVAGVPYRYNREFSGKITHMGNTYNDAYKLFVRYNNVIPNTGSYIFEKLLEDSGKLHVARFGDSTIRCVGEQEAHEVYLDILHRDPNYFITNPFIPEQADNNFVTRRMVAL